MFRKKPHDLYVFFRFPRTCDYYFLPPISYISCIKSTWDVITDRLILQNQAWYLIITYTLGYNDIEHYGEPCKYGFNSWGKGAILPLNKQTNKQAIKHDRLCKLSNHFFYADEFVFCHHFLEDSKTSFFALTILQRIIEAKLMVPTFPLSFQLLIPKPSFEKWYVSETKVDKDCFKKIQIISSVEMNLIIFSLLRHPTILP